MFVCTSRKLRVIIFYGRTYKRINFCFEFASMNARFTSLELKMQPSIMYHAVLIFNQNSAVFIHILVYNAE